MTNARYYETPEGATLPQIHEAEASADAVLEAILTAAQAGIDAGRADLLDALERIYGECEKGRVATFNQLEAAAIAKATGK